MDIYVNWRNRFLSKCRLDMAIHSDRNKIKSDLIRIIEEDRMHKEKINAAEAKMHEHDKDRILLRISAAVNAISDLDELLDEILDQLIKAVNVERAFVLLKDELTGKLQLAKGRNDRRDPLFRADLIEGNIFNAVFEQGQPIVSANVRCDPRVLKRDLIISGALGKALLCAPKNIGSNIGSALCRPFVAGGRPERVGY